jgi:hypothetical protein
MVVWLGDAQPTGADEGSGGDAQTPIREHHHLGTVKK